ncbi:MAG: RluA family pseudouridine synthase [Candidatus Omnitrophica bacterium]|nr:RluA family pseudouridine synthase [Candidatus Omnitrophota bacterium]MDD5771394.1 RluA family pseudouridine synthase [Candidatus Omnitrophota bacterium]
MSIPVVYEDNWLLVVDKPAGLLSVPTPRKECRTLTSILNREASERGKKFRLYPCHRLDRQTSGLVIYAKDKAIEQKMADAFRNRLVHKRYIAFIHGKLSQRQGRIGFNIEGKNALTKYRVVQEKSNYSVVEVFPVTGRTNQIRIHFKGIKHPLVGEDKFVFRRDFALRFRRVCLQATALRFRHPVTGKELTLSIGLAQDLKDFLSRHD